MVSVHINTAAHSTAFTVSVDHKNTTTGISAFERSDTIQALLDEQTSPDDLKRPGHVFPLIAHPGGVLARPGHTEAAVDLALLAGSKPAAVICEIMKNDGTMALVPDLFDMAEQFGLKIITIKELIRFKKSDSALLL